MTGSLFWKKLLIRTGVARFLPVAKRLTGGGTEYLRYYSDDILSAPVNELLDPATFPEPPGPDVIDLNHAAPRLDFAGTLGRLSGEPGRKPSAWGLPALRQAIADNARNRDGRAVDPAEEVLVTHGATAGFAATLDAFVNPGDRVVLFDPCSPLFAVGAKSRRAKVRWVPTRMEDGRTRFDPAALASAVRGAKLIALADPGSPTGGTFADDDLERIADIAKRADALIYLDESFGRFRYDSPASRLASLPAAVGRTISAGSMTYEYGLGALRVGWLTGNRHLIRPVGLTANLSAPFVPVPCQQAALKAVQSDDELFGPVVEEFRARRRYTADQLRAMGFTVNIPGGGFFFWLKVAELGMDGRAFAERLLKERNVLVGPGSAFGPSGGDFVRLSFAGDDGRLREGLGRLAAFVKGNRGGEVAKPVEAADMVEAADEVAPPTADRPPAFSRV